MIAEIAVFYLVIGIIILYYTYKGGPALKPWELPTIIAVWPAIIFTGICMKIGEWYDAARSYLSNRS